MTWFKVDDSFYDHPKVFDAPDCALALWTRAGCWSARNLTDGFVPATLPARLCDDPDTAVRELVGRGLWIRTKGGHHFHDWTTYQPSGDEVRDLRQKRAEAGRKGGQAKAAKQTASKSQASASGVAKQNAAPSRPVPSRRDGDGSVGDHLSVADVRASDGREIFISEYGLSPDLADRAMATIGSRTKVKDWPKLIAHMAGNGTLADVVDPLQRATYARSPEASPEARATATGCERHPEGPTDPTAPEGWGVCLLCNTHRRRATRGRTA